MEFPLCTGHVVKNQIMQTWERPYMRRLSDVATSRGGAVLEIGYGMGISASFIQQAPSLSTHVVIECHPAICAQARKRWRTALRRGRMNILEGFWEDVTPSLQSESFDGILFDSCPLDKDIELFHFFPFFHEAYRLLKGDGVLTYFSDEPRGLSQRHRRYLRAAGFKLLAHEVCEVNPPPDCRYWKHQSIVVPIIRKVCRSESTSPSNHVAVPSTPRGNVGVSSDAD
jgi:guanidinoacetate N-methyltransferase